MEVAPLAEGGGVFDIFKTLARYQLFMRRLPFANRLQVVAVAMRALPAAPVQGSFSRPAN